MKLQRFNDWNGLLSTPTKERDGGCSWRGIAIGPDSHEGIVRVNGITLQAGRVLPLEAKQYTLEQVIPNDGRDDFPSIQRLEVMLFEDGAELAVNVARPNAQFHQKSALNTVSISVPFSGRRQALVRIDWGGGDTVDYQVYGRSFNAAADAVKSATLADEAAVAADDDGGVAFYIGGTNEAECWDELEINAQCSAADLPQIHVTVIGEIGA